MAVGDVSIRGVSFKYPDGQPALTEVSLEITGGDSVGVLGCNGAGKSTLLQHFNGLLRGTGEVFIGELLLGEKTLNDIRARVGLVFQDPDDQLFMPTVFDDVAYGPRCRGLPETEVRRRVERSLAVVGLAAEASRPPHHLSLGQKKRAALATVLSLDCEVLVLDEPTSGLDPRGRRELLAYLRKVPCTRIVATHDLEFALELCTRAVVLDGGRVAAEGPIRELLADHTLMERTGLEVPHSLRFHALGHPHHH